MSRRRLSMDFAIVTMIAVVVSIVAIGLCIVCRAMALYDAVRYRWEKSAKKNGLLDADLSLSPVHQPCDVGAMHDPKRGGQ